MKISSIKKDNKLQLVIDGVLQFREGKYHCGTPYKQKILVSKDQVALLQKIANSRSEYPYVINNFEYNDFMGRTLDDNAQYTGKFYKWTNNPEVVQMKCSDGKLRCIPTFAIPGSALFPKRIATTDKIELFSKDCKS